MLTPARPRRKAGETVSAVAGLGRARVRGDWQGQAPAHRNRRTNPVPQGPVPWAGEDAKGPREQPVREAIGGPVGEMPWCG
jgi:hypothetical protein